MPTPIDPRLRGNASLKLMPGVTPKNVYADRPSTLNVIDRGGNLSVVDENKIDWDYSLLESGEPVLPVFGQYEQILYGEPTLTNCTVVEVDGFLVATAISNGDVSVEYSYTHTGFATVWVYGDNEVKAGFGASSGASKVTQALSGAGVAGAYVDNAVAGSKYHFIVNACDKEQKKSYVPIQVTPVVVPETKGLSYDCLGIDRSNAAYEYSFRVDNVLADQDRLISMSDGTGANKVDLSISGSSVQLSVSFGGTARTVTTSNNLAVDFSNTISFGWYSVTDKLYINSNGAGVVAANLDGVRVMSGMLGRLLDSSTNWNRKAISGSILSLKKIRFEDI